MSFATLPRFSATRKWGRLSSVTRSPLLLTSVRWASWRRWPRTAVFAVMAQPQWKRARYWWVRPIGLFWVDA